MRRRRPGLPVFAALLLAAGLVWTAPTAAADWKPVHATKTYAISGDTPIGLYTSIGENGPLAGAARAIALTSWALKWQRDYQPDGSACVLKSALPFLTITTTLPKPKARLAPPVAARWKAFIAGITAHEQVHGADIVAMVDRIIAATVGLRVENDPGCTAIRAAVLKEVEAANEDYKARSRAFDASEMRDGGAVHRLVLALVNG